MLPGGNRQQEPVSRSAPAANRRVENYRSRLMRGGCGFVLGYRLVGGLLFQFAFEFVQLALDGVRSPRPTGFPANDLDWWHATRSSPGMLECDRCYLVSLFKVFIKSENDLGTRRTLCEAVEFVHLVLDEVRPAVCRRRISRIESVRS